MKTVEILENLQPLPGKEGFALFIQAKIKTGVMESFTFMMLMWLAINALEIREALNITQLQIHRGCRWEASLSPSKFIFFTDNFAFLPTTCFGNPYQRNIICERII